MRIFSGNSSYIIGILIHFCLGWTFLLVHTASWGLVVILLWILPLQRMASWCTCNFFYLILGFLNGITVSPLSGPCHSPCHQHHTLQWECHLLHQMFGKPLKISPILLWNMSPAGTIQKGSLENLYLPDWQVSVVTWEGFYHVLHSNTLNWHQLLSLFYAFVSLSSN